jgi:hypothetical protein
MTADPSRVSLVVLVEHIETIQRHNQERHNILSITL